MFLLNHPSLLNYTEKYGLHALVDQVIKRLDNTEYVEVTDWLKYELGEAWYHLVRVLQSSIELTVITQCHGIKLVSRMFQI